MTSFGMAVAILLGLFAVGAQAQPVVVPVPQVDGPITGPGDMQPALRPGPDGTNLSDFDYIDEEYFISGTAAGLPYKTRIVIRRPKTPEKFSGVVVAEPTHRGGNGLICQFARYGIGQRGHICMTVAARRINLSNPNTPGAGLYEFNLARYGSLTYTDRQTNEIIAQAGRLLRENLSGGVLSGYSVRHVVMAGTSDSSGATRAYMTSSTMLDHRTLRMPDGSPIYEGYFVSSILGQGQIPPLADAPIIQMPTQYELHNGNGFRRPDSDTPDNRFRSYEISGMSHNDARENPAFTGCTHPELSHFPYGAMTFMGLQHLIDWAVDGTIPPRAAQMEIDEDLTKDDTRVATDQFGNAKGGVRTPYLDVPLFTIHIPNAGPGLCYQTGWLEPLAPKVMHDLYKNYGDYVSQVEHRLKELMDDGWFPKEYATRYVQGDLKLYPK